MPLSEKNEACSEVALDLVDKKNVDNVDGHIQLKGASLANRRGNKELVVSRRLHQDPVIESVIIS